MRLLAHCIQDTDENAANGLRDGIKKLIELRTLLGECAPHVLSSAAAEHMLDGFRRKPHPIDGLVARLSAELEPAPAALLAVTTLKHKPPTHPRKQNAWH